MTTMWKRLAQLRWWWRWGVKTALLGLVVFEVLFPHPVLLVRELRALQNDEPLIQPQMAAMEGINAEIDKMLEPAATREQQFKAVERFVYQKIKYQYDWYNWGNLDYWPTAEEVWERKKEDCDGRAVLAASILRARGFPTAKIVANLNHAWVTVDGDELMGPQAEKNLRREGGRVIVTLPGWRTWMDTFAFISQFPAVRSLIILFAVVVLAYHPCKHWAGFFGVTTMALTGFVLLFHWGSMRMGREVSGADGESYAAAVLLMGALVLAWTMPYWLRRFQRPVGQAAAGGTPAA